MLLLFVLIIPIISAVKQLTNGPHGLFQFVNNGFGVEYCAIPKTGSTITKRILCDVLLDYKGIPHQQRFARNITANTECQRNGNYWSRWETKWNRPIFQTVKFSIVRDPIERFVSLYGDMCEKHHFCQGRNIHKFAEWVYSMQKNDGELRSQPLQHLLYHSWAQTRFCSIKNKEVIIVHHSHNKKKMEAEFMRVLRKAHVPVNIAKRALRHLTKSSTRDAARDKSHKKQLKRSLLTNKKTMEYLKAMYYDDFKFLKKHKF